MSSWGARNDTSKVENNKTQQPENTADNNQILAAVIAHMQGCMLHDIDATCTSQYNFLTKFYLRISLFFNQKYEIVRFLRIP